MHECHTPTSSQDGPSSSSLKPEQFWKWFAVALLVLFVFVMLFNVRITPRFRNVAGNRAPSTPAAAAPSATDDTAVLEQAVLAPDGITLPVAWGDLGKKMVDTGVIDQEQFESIYTQRGGLDATAQQLLSGDGNESIHMALENSGFLLNLFWAFGLANKNIILETGPMNDPQYGGAGEFASTGGWTLAKGDPMAHYSTHAWVVLTPEQQALVERVSKNIYRPCCGNSVYFPDCNHGMAMLGLLELLAANGIQEEEMYRIALQVNAYWFPDTYLTVAKYFQKRGIAWANVNPRDALGEQYSSAYGYQQVRAEVEPVQQSGGGGCGV